METGNSSVGVFAKKKLSNTTSGCLQEKIRFILMDSLILPLLLPNGFGGRTTYENWVDLLIPFYFWIPDRPSPSFTAWYPYPFSVRKCHFYLSISRIVFGKFYLLINITTLVISFITLYFKQKFVFLANITFIYFFGSYDCCLNKHQNAYEIN